MVKPTHGRVLVRIATQEDITKSGIIIPESVKSKEENILQSSGVVYMISDTIAKPGFKPGDLVFFSPHIGVPVDLGNVLLLSLEHKQIVAYEEMPPPEMKGPIPVPKKDIN